MDKDFENFLHEIEANTTDAGPGLDFSKVRVSALKNILISTLIASAVIGMVIIVLSYFPPKGPEGNRALETLLQFSLTTSTTIIGVFIGSALEQTDKFN